MSISLFSWALILGTFRPQAEGQVKPETPPDPRIFCHVRVEKVVEVPHSPGRLQIRGVFMMATKDPSGTITGYEAPERGHLDLLLPCPPNAKSDELYLQVCKTLSGAAGKGICMSLRSQFAEDRVRLRKSGERKSDPDRCVLHASEVKQDGKASFEWTAPLRSLPVPVHPDGAREVVPGTVTLVARVGSSGKVVAVGFEIQSDTGEKENGRTDGSPDGTDLRWSPRMVLKAGARYQWRVWHITREGDGTVVETDFSVRKASRE